MEATHTYKHGLGGPRRAIAWAMPLLAVALFILSHTAAAQYDYAAYVFPRNTLAGAKPLFAAIIQRYPNIDIQLDASNTQLQLTSTVPVIEQDISDAADDADFALFFFVAGVWGMGTGSPDPQAMSFPAPGPDMELDPAQYDAMKSAWIQENPEAYERLKRSGATVLAPQK
ncbi:MAG: hypothetical protein KDC00_04260 [Flavobacteriales bacterium]|nr:hypothetical protein [Flavobacteriales bacterium]